MGTVSLNCKACGREFVVAYKHRAKKFCDRACYFSKPEYNPFYGKSHTKATLDHLHDVNHGLYDGDRNPFFGKKHSTQSRQKMSKTRSEKIATGEINCIHVGRKGKHAGVPYDSAYELKRLADLGKDESVAKFSKNNHLFIVYEYNGCRHRYIPDFIVTYHDKQVVVEEIKGYERDVDHVKYEAAKNQLAELGVGFRVLYKADLFKSEHHYREFLKEMYHEIRGDR